MILISSLHCTISILKVILIRNCLNRRNLTLFLMFNMGIYLCFLPQTPLCTSKESSSCNYFFSSATSSKPLFSKHNILSLYSIYKFHVACFLFSHFNSLLPTPVSSILHFNSEYHDYMTRSRFNLHKTCHKYQFAITWQAPIIWNDIPLTVRNNLTVSNFKKNLRLYFSE